MDAVLDVGGPCGPKRHDYGKGWFRDDDIDLMLSGIQSLPTIPVRSLGQILRVSEAAIERFGRILISSVESRKLGRQVLGPCFPIR